MARTKEQLARSLSLAGVILGRMGKQEESLDALKEAVEILRQLAAKDPLQFKDELASALHNRGATLSDLGSLVEARTSLIEAATMFRELAQERPDRFYPNLAKCLSELGWALRKSGQQLTALEVLQEARSLYDLLAQRRPDAFGPYLAKNLIYLALCLLDLSRPQEASDVVKEARPVVTRWARDYPDAAKELESSWGQVEKKVALNTIGEPDTRVYTSQKENFLIIPQPLWRPELSPPGALLRADYGIVPFHGRERELADLRAWCQDPAMVRVRLYTGPGGVGKTRLALEIAKRLQSEGWLAGFLAPEALHASEDIWKAISQRGGKTLVILDYAETRREILVPLLRRLYATNSGPIRLILIARAAFDWWEQLQTEGQGVGELLSGPATSRYSLAPLALSLEERGASYQIASDAFARYLKREPPSEVPDNLDQPYFDRVLLLHMAALLALERGSTQGEDGILDALLSLEMEEWKALAWRRSLPEIIVHGISRAMAAITMGGGVAGEKEAMDLLRELRFFKDQPGYVLQAVVQLLHERYSGDRWIEPILPDMLGEHLVQRELENGADELLDLVLGPRSGA